MTERVGDQLPFGITGMELVINLDTGEEELRRRKAGKSVQGSVKAPAPIREWWEGTGLRAFNSALEGWRRFQAAVPAEELGHNVESSVTLMTEGDTKELLKKAFRIAKRSRITSENIVKMIRAESLSLEERFGANNVDWLPAFTNSAIDSLADVYGLNPVNTAGLKKFVHQRRLPQFS